MENLNWKAINEKIKANLEKAKEAKQYEQEEQPPPELLNPEAAKKVAEGIMNRTYWIKKAPIGLTVGDF